MYAQAVQNRICQNIEAGEFPWYVNLELYDNSMAVGGIIC